MAKRNHPIYVMPPKVAKASTVVIVMCHCCLKNFANVNDSLLVVVLPKESRQVEKLRGAQKITGDGLKLVWAEFSTLSQAVFVISVIAWHTLAHPHLELKAQPKFNPWTNFS